MELLIPLCIFVTSIAILTISGMVSYYRAFHPRDPKGMVWCHSEKDRVVHRKGTLLHRKKGPAIIFDSGRQEWWFEGKLHNETGPAIIGDDGEVSYYINGKQLTEAEFFTDDRLTKKVESGTTTYFWKGMRHRINGPAVIYSNGEVCWYRFGWRDREDGPAVIKPSGTKKWYKHNKYHREDGPAIEWADGSTEYYLHGVNYTEGAYVKMIAELKKSREKLTTTSSADAESVGSWDFRIEHYTNSGGSDTQCDLETAMRNVGKTSVVAKSKQTGEDTPVMDIRYSLRDYASRGFLQSSPADAAFLGSLSSEGVNTMQKLFDDEEITYPYVMLFFDKLGVVPPIDFTAAVIEEPCGAKKKIFRNCDKTVIQYQNSIGQWHRDGGPAETILHHENPVLAKVGSEHIRYDRYEAFWQNGRKHHVRGPAVLWYKGDTVVAREYHLNGERMSHYLWRQKLSVRSDDVEIPEDEPSKGDEATEEHINQPIDTVRVYARPVSTWMCKLYHADKQGAVLSSVDNAYRTTVQIKLGCLRVNLFVIVYHGDYANIGEVAEKGFFQELTKENYSTIRKALYDDYIDMRILDEAFERAGIPLPTDETPARLEWVHPKHAVTGKPIKRQNRMSMLVFIHRSGKREDLIEIAWKSEHDAYVIDTHGTMATYESLTPEDLDCACMTLDAETGMDAEPLIRVAFDRKYCQLPKGWRSGPET